MGPNGAQKQIRFYMGTWYSVVVVSEIPLCGKIIYSVVLGRLAKYLQKLRDLGYKHRNSVEFKERERETVATQREQPGSVLEFYENILVPDSLLIKRKKIPPFGKRL